MKSSRKRIKVPQGEARKQEGYLSVGIVPLGSQEPKQNKEAKLKLKAPSAETDGA
ncbi:hypothetical protein DFO70_106406 [Cytobacillus firmus]|uniref:Uncharacterized protein n=2 Tax=Cytobacillus TaxID=2675230 RepID=A0A366JXD9_CYTFI|nr:MULTISPECIES: hypothetical protein [Cytobacillus]RBP93271.1 hypothetical protein DFO70_106406 [Cytobacillus firmus]TDX42873.1 hypothetical protein DFO72_106406 [Cytobacillus oceanisediminis]